MKIILFVLLFSIAFGQMQNFFLQPNFFKKDEVKETVTVKEGEYIIHIPSNPSTGYLWSLENESTLKYNRHVTDVDYEGFLSGGPSEIGIQGRPGRQRFHFKASKGPNEELIFSYRRPWDRSKANVLKVTVVVI